MSHASSAELPVSPAATVLLVRDAATGLQVLLMQRAAQLAFHGGAWVFPGGRVDAADCSDADELAAARRAAVRETREEAGVMLEPERLACFSHWTTPPGRTRRFATWFFLACVPAELEVVADGVEMRAHRWLGPREALALHAAGELELPPPTFVSLSVLARCARTEEAFALARACEAPRFVPRLRASEHGEVALYHGDAAYEGSALEAPGPRHRLLWLADGYRYERTP